MGVNPKEELARKFHAELMDRYGAMITRPGHPLPDHVIPAPGTLPMAAGGRAGPGGSPGSGQKIASTSAGARAPEARAAARAKEPDPEIPEQLKTKPNRKENEFMMNLMILRNTMKRNAPACRERARLAGKWVWRDIRLLTVLVERIQEKLLRTMPESRDDYYRAYAQHGHYELHMDGPVRTPRHILMTDKHAAALAEAAMKSECILCMREGNEIGRCELREALLESAVPTAIEDGDSLFRKCEYRDAAGALVQGKDVTI